MSETHTYRYVCLNSECESKKVEMRKLSNGTRTTYKLCSIDFFPFRKTHEQAKAEEEACPVCAQKLKPLGIIAPLVFSKLSLMTREQKSAMLSERSKQHSWSDSEIVKRREEMHHVNGFKQMKKPE